MSQRWEMLSRGNAALPRDFAELVENDAPQPRKDEVLIEVHQLAIEPYQRAWMRSCRKGDTPPADVLGTVLASNTTQFGQGDLVVTKGSWATHVTAAADRVRKVHTAPDLPTVHELGLFGLSGLTGYFGVTRVARPKPGQKVVISGASGGVGQVACQIARWTGADVMAVVGSRAKAAIMQDLDVPVVVHREPDWVDEVRDWAPGGVHVYFDTVWGDVSASLVDLLAPGGRVALCGQISGYDGNRVEPLPLRDWFVLLARSLTIQGFRTMDYERDFDAARAYLRSMFREGRLRQSVEVARGLSAVPSVFRRMLIGDTSGKLVVDIKPA